MGESFESPLQNTLWGYIIGAENTPWGYEGSEPMEQNCCGACGGCRHKHTPRSERELRQLQNRLNRMVGQLGGISKMLEENRYCGDILTQVAAVESALQSFGYLVLKEHMETCVVENIQAGNTQIVDEAVELIKKLK